MNRLAWHKEFGPELDHQSEYLEQLIDYGFEIIKTLFVWEQQGQVNECPQKVRDSVASFLRLTFRALPRTTTTLAFFVAQIDGLVAHIFGQFEFGFRGGDSDTEQMGLHYCLELGGNSINGFHKKLSHLMIALDLLLETNPLAAKALVSHFVDGRQQTEIAAEFGLPVQKINSEIKNALDLLRECSGIQPRGPKAKSTRAV